MNISDLLKPFPGQVAITNQVKFLEGQLHLVHLLLLHLCQQLFVRAKAG